MGIRTSGRMAAAAALAVAVAACGAETTAPADGTVIVELVRGDAAAAQLEPPAASTRAVPADGPTAGDGAFGRVPLESVTSIDVVITSVELFSVASEEAQEGGSGADRPDLDAFVSLPVQDGTIDLLAVPAAGADPVVLAWGEEVPTATYQGLRLRFGNASLTLAERVAVGDRVYEPGTHELVIPSGQQTGIEVRGVAVVVDDGVRTITVVFDIEASLGDVLAGSSGRLLMTPVLGATTR